MTYDEIDDIRAELAAESLRSRGIRTSRMTRDQLLMEYAAMEQKFWSDSIEAREILRRTANADLLPSLTEVWHA